MSTFKNTDELLKQLEDAKGRLNGEEFAGFRLGIAFAIEIIKSTPDANVIEAEKPKAQVP